MANKSYRYSDQSSSAIRALLILIAVISCSCSKQSNPTAPGPVPIPQGIVLDEYPAWSPDGRTIVFHRKVTTSYGPPGLYALDLLSSTLRWVASGDASWPTDIRYSPDGLSVLANWQGELFRVHLDNGLREQIPVG